MTSMARAVTVVNFALAVMNTAYFLLIGFPEVAVIMMWLFLVFQAGITWWESEESAIQESKSLTRILSEGRVSRPDRQVSPRAARVASALSERRSTRW